MGFWHKISKSFFPFFFAQNQAREEKLISFESHKVNTN